MNPLIRRAVGKRRYWPSFSALALAAAANATFAQPSATSAATSPAAAEGPASATATAQDALVREAVLYAYPYQEFMKMRHAALSDKSSPTFTSLNRFRHSRHLATPKDRWANGPINDTFYSTTWFDVGTSPLLLDVPQTEGRYYVIALIAADLNTFAYIGRRVGGTSARRIAIVAPGWNGRLPAVDQVIRAPSRDIYLNMRVLVDGPEDAAAAHAVQDAFHTTPLDSRAALDEPGQVPRADDWARFVDVSNEALTRNPPPASEQALLERLAAVGICGQACSWKALPAEVQARWLKLAPQVEKELKTTLNADRTTPDPRRRNGWVPYRLPSSFGRDYRMRAASAAMSGAILGLEAAEASYFAASVDGDKRALGEGASYRLHLPQGRLPADAFWSISLYEFVPGGQYMVENPINRYSIGDRTRGLKFNPDGSLDIWIQPHEPSTDKRANWLPSPLSNRFYLMARAYQPWPVVQDPAWTPEPVQRLDQP